MTGENHCPHCGSELPANAPEGVCPRCLLQAGLGNDAPRTAHAPAIEGPGSQIGRYELLELIGEGGMGLVYLAEQKEPVKRTVALKIVKLGMDTRRVVARFEAERQTLALLEHPNIAHVFDAGTTDSGRPYFVMEYVKGRSITRYCDEKKLCIEKRLELFRQVCEGIHHAHQKGIIHRDIKPSNILVSVQDDRPVPKIIDFGIAKAITQPLTEKTSYTEQGQLLGTPEYMSPEQADMAYQDVDTRSDIYSLGVLLYELLAGATPFDAERLREGGIDRIQQVICQEEPRTPSARLTSLGDEAKVVAERRRTQIITLARRLHRELEWIPMKAMRKDRTRRYRSASELADDIQNYLTGTPLIAGPESTVYRARKFVRKHAGSVATAALVSLAVILGLVVSIAFGQRAEQARQQEAAARVEAEQARDKEAALRAQLEQALARAEKAEKEAQERAEAYRRAVYANNLSMAKDAFDAGNSGRARKILESCEPDLRGWEWEHLNYMSADPCVRILRGLKDDVYSVAVSQDGRLIVSGSGDGMIKMWDAETGSEVVTMYGHTRGVYAVAFSPDRTRIASGDYEGVIKIWDTASGTEVKTLPGHSDWIGSVAFSPDGKHIASGGKDRVIKVWEMKSGAEVMTLRGHRGSIVGAAYSLDGKLIVSGSGDGTIKVWDAETGAEIRTLTGLGDGVDVIALSPDGSCIASAKGKTVTIWDAHTGDERVTMHGHRNVIASVAFSPDGKRIASASRDDTIRIWNVNTGEEERSLSGHTSGVLAVVFSPDGKQIISGSYDQTVRVWDPAIDREVLERYGGTTFCQVVFSPDGKRIAASARRRKIVLIDALSGEDILTLHRPRPNSPRDRTVAFSPDGNRIVAGVGRLGQVVEVWNALTGAREMTLRGHTERVRSVAFSPNGKHIVSGSEDETIKVWNASTGALERTLTGHKDVVRSLTFSPDGRHIISGSEDGTIRTWEAFSGTELLTLHGHEEGVGDVSVSSDGKQITSCGGGTIKTWDVTTGEELMTLTLHDPEFGTGAVAFSPDGRRIVSGHGNGAIKIWDAGTGMGLIDLRVNAGSGIYSAAFSPDGKSICVGNDGGGIALFESVEPVVGQEARRIANSASRLVDELYIEHELYEDVISRLRDDDTVVEEVRSKALQIADARLEQDAAELRWQASLVIFSADNNDVEYREALEKLEKAVSYNPTNGPYLHELGVAQYRLRAYEDALATMTRAKKMKGVAGFINDGHRAMALQQLGREKEAKVALQQSRSGYGGWWISHKHSSFFFKCICEVEKFFAGEDSTLLPIWELVEENELDEASELIEKVRLSNDAEAIDRMEGAVKLLEVLRNLK